ASSQSLDCKERPPSTPAMKPTAGKALRLETRFVPRSSSGKREDQTMPEALLFAPTTARAWTVIGPRRFRSRAASTTDSARRSALARILWRDEQGRPVRHDEPGAKSYAPGEAPVAEPEYPAERGIDSDGWTEVGDIYRAPSKAAQAIVELHLRWASRAQVEWSEV